jgi:hypothetical protein
MEEEVGKGKREKVKGKVERLRCNDFAIYLHPSPESVAETMA